MSHDQEMVAVPFLQLKQSPAQHTTYCHDMSKQPERERQSLSTLQEWARIEDDQEFLTILRIFKEAGLYFVPFKEKDGTQFCLFMDEKNQVQAVNTHAAASYIGLFFPTQSRVPEIRKQHQTFMQRVYETQGFENTQIPLYYRELLLELADTATWQVFGKQAGITQSKDLEMMRAATRHSNAWLLPQFIENDSQSKPKTKSKTELLGFYFGDETGVPLNLSSESEAFEPIVAYASAQGGKKATKQRIQELQEMYQPILRQDTVPVHPINGPHVQNMLLEAKKFAQAQEITPRSGPESTNVDREQFRQEVRGFLQRHFETLGIDVIDYRKITQMEQADSMAHLHRTEVVNYTTDLIFIKSGAQVAEIATAPPLAGWKAPKKKGDPITEQTAYGNVVGVIIVPDSASLRYRKEAMRVASRKLRNDIPAAPQGGVANPTILTVDPQLLYKWQQEGTPFADPLTVSKMMKETEKKRFDYGFEIHTPRKPEKIELIVNEPGGKSHIGGTQLEVAVHYDSITRKVHLDMGWLFSLVPQWNKLGGKPPYHAGISPYLKQGLFPPLPRFYQNDLINLSINSGALKNALNSMSSGKQPSHTTYIDQFLILEAYHRFGEEGFFDFIANNPKTRAVWHEWHKNNKVQDARTLLQHFHQQRYDHKIIYDALAITHAHQDHSVGSSTARDEITRAWSPITRALLTADHRMGPDHMIQNQALRKMREREKQGSAYPVFEYPHLLVEHGKRYEVAQNIFLTGFEVPHSIPGALGYLVEVEDGRRNVLASAAYGGDYKGISFFENVGRSGGTDLLLAEATNLPTNTSKQSASVTEYDVRENMARAVYTSNQHGEAVVTKLVKNSFERIENLIEIARQQGRTLALSAKIVNRLHQLEVQLLGREELPHIPFGDNQIKVWKPHKSRYRSFENDMFQLYDTVTPEEVAQNGEHYLIVYENGEKLTQFDSIGAKVHLVRSVYGAYDQAGRQEKQYEEDYAADRGWRLSQSRLHATGHQQLLFAKDDPQNQGILANIHKAKGKRKNMSVLFVHTQGRRVAADAAQEYPQNRDLDFIRRVPQHPRSSFELYPKKPTR